MNGPHPDRHGDRSGFTVNIGTVHGDNYNVAGDVYVGTTRVPAREIPDRLRTGLRRAALDPPDERDAHDCVDDIDEALRQKRPDRQRIARALRRLTRVLSATGTLVAAGAALVDPMTGLALWLGEIGKSVLSELRNG